MLRTLRIHHQIPRLHSPILLNQQRFFAMGRTATDFEANGEETAVLFNQLLRKGKYSQIISQYEANPALQGDKECLSLVFHSFLTLQYITALARDGQFNKIADQVQPRQEKAKTSFSQPVQNIRTDRNKWQQRGVNLSNNGNNEPIPIIVTGTSVY
jgi:hypothetical protein